jgi:opacity protein-like surface antigen
MRSRSYLALCLLVLVATSATAQGYARPGAYASINGVAAFDSIDGVPSSALDNAIGVAGRLGYRFTPYLAAEGQVEYSGDFIDCCGADLTATLVTVNAKLYVLQDQLQPYVLAGMGGAFGNASGVGVSVNENGFVAKVGGGLDFYINENLGLELEAAYNIGTGDLDDFNYTSLGWGAFYRF